MITLSSELVKTIDSNVVAPDALAVPTINDYVAMYRQLHNAVNEIKNTKKVNINTEQITLILFTQKYNGLCTIINRIVRETENKYKNDMTFTYYDVDKDYDIARHYNITEVPALHIYNDKVVIDHFIGAFTKKDLQEKIDQILNKKT